MIQLKNNKWLIIIFSILLLFLLLFFVSKFIFNKDDKKEQVQASVRTMTNQEKQEVGIKENIDAEVLNDNNGMFIYQIKK